MTGQKKETPYQRLIAQKKGLLHSSELEVASSGSNADLEQN
jgi:hypothetical protein